MSEHARETCDAIELLTRHRKTAPLCNQCEQEMRPAEGVIPIWQCVCGREVPRV